MIVLLAALLLAQAEPGQERKELPVPDTAHPAVNEHGATLGHQEAAAEQKGEHEKAGTHRIPLVSGKLQLSTAS